MKTLSHKQTTTVITAATALGVATAIIVGLLAASGSRPLPVILGEAPVSMPVSPRLVVTDCTAAPVAESMDLPAASATVDALVGRLHGYATKFTALREQHGGLVTVEFREAAEKVFAAMMAELRAAPKEVAAGAMAAYLNSNEDSLTGLNFIVGEGGLLTEAPSLRTAMLDALAQIDPAKSVTLAQQVLAESQSPDEWTLAMRNLGLRNADGSHTTELRLAFQKMLDNQAWLEEGSLGFMKAFDVAVALAGPEEFEALAGLVNLENSDGQRVENCVSQEACRALERMAVNHPDQVLRQLDADPEMLSWAPEQRGALMARANLADAAQRAAIETYLQRADLSHEEIAAFFEKFASGMNPSGYALLSTIAPDFQQKLASDAAAAAAVNQWLQDPRFQAYHAELRQIGQRLAGQAVQGSSVKVARL